MASALSVLTTAILLFSLIRGVRAQQQNVDPAAVFGTIHEAVGQVGRNLSCDALKAAVRRTIDAHSDWRDWLYEFRHNQSDFIDQCESGETGQVQEFLEEQKNLLTCPEAYNRTWVLAIVFIILFLLALISLIVLGILYVRK